MKRILIATLLLFAWAVIKAHEGRPLYIKFIQTGEEIQVDINIPNTVQVQNFPLIRINSDLINEVEQWKSYGAGYKQKFTISDISMSLRGAQIEIEFPVFNPVLNSILAITHSDGEEQLLIIPPGESFTVIPLEVSATEVRCQYTVLGAEHIWAGIDHLLFVICLVIIAGFSRMLLVTITGFTIAHSLTLVLSALNVIKLPIPPIEATIALSIVFLCYEIIHHHKDKQSLTYKYPILVASSFGLLHGLGFAAVLGEIGLPDRFRFEALLFFNIGVELGQVIFIVALLVLAYAARLLMKKIFANEQQLQFLSYGLQVAVYAVGILASYWMFDRIL